jgi:hypothetical protein
MHGDGWNEKNVRSPGAVYGLFGRLARPIVSAGSDLFEPNSPARIRRPVHPSLHSKIRNPLRK